MGNIMGNFTSGSAPTGAGTGLSAETERGVAGQVAFFWARRLAGLAAALLVVAGDHGEARAQCSTGTFIGSCNDGVGFEGCCNGQRATWCEGAARCEVNCAENINSPQNSCCAPSNSPGCCDSQITACVCAIDDFCCGAEDPFFGDPGFWDDLCVDLALSNCGGCGSCSGPATQCGWQGGEGFYDCMATASADPTGANPRVCGGGCTPQCSGRQCGTDGCGGICGQCSASQSCNALTGQCTASCTPQCSGRQCGPNGCGGVCGQCSASQSCNSATGQCAASCTPQCSGRQCGTDGCGGVCGQCLSGQSCNSATGQCAASCTPACNGKACGADGCGATCGECPLGRSCEAGACVSECTASCAGKVCGDDGCGGSCGTCSTGDSCDGAGACVSSCGCDGKQCGDDGCGRVCGFCGPNTVCNAETNQCDARPVTQPDQDQTIPQPEACPKGQIWSQYVGACVLDPNAGGVAGKSSSGCAGGWGGTGALSLMGVGLVLVGARRKYAIKGR